MVTTANLGDAALSEFECPRCHRGVAERFYGPCQPCRDELRSTLGHEPTGAPGLSRFEPKMNVVPNHVATKED
jgi:hypothetical protein